MSIPGGSGLAGPAGPSRPTKPNKSGKPGEAERLAKMTTHCLEILRLCREGLRTSPGFTDRNFKAVSYGPDFLQMFLSYGPEGAEKLYCLTIKETLPPANPPEASRKV